MRKLLVLLSLLGAAGCAVAPSLTVANPQGAMHTSLTDLLAAHPLPPGQNGSAVLLGRTESMSYHLVQIRDREQPHLHATHDLTVTLVRGTGQFHIRGAVYDMRSGDVAVVPRGTPHYFVNTGTAPAVAFATFAPPYDGQDQVATQ